MERLTRWFDLASPNTRLKEKLTILFSLITIISFANNGEDPGKECKPIEWIERHKSITFAYPLSGSDKVSLDNQFGDVKVSFWEKNEVKVEVMILANASSEERAEDYIRNVDVVGKKSDGMVSIKTTIDREDSRYSNNTWNKSGNGEKNSLRIDYKVFMPKSTVLKVKNSFGNTYLPIFTASLVVNQSYGKLIAEEISNPNSEVNLEFCKGSSIKSMAGGKLRASYSSIKMERADDVIFNNSFGEIDIKEVGKLNAKISYSSGIIGTINESSNLKLEFSGGFKLGELGKNVKELNINANYSPINLTLNDAAAYDFEVKANYGNFSYPNDKGVSFSRNTETESKKQEHYSFNPTKCYSGKIGKGSPECKIVVNGNFSNVRFK
ncbi:MULTISPECIES: DUF4097 family beta strand repeat-containing protein [Emticicia]|uniref:DUF4097 family beta strand repeat-containing protein n=1 Tax=Emticicia TaxID=312278 RepID=UPI0007D8BCBA|nr:MULTISPECIES: DUF4097 family beta strand repeat-containing protein [Emticicia]